MARRQEGLPTRESDLAREAELDEAFKKISQETDKTSNIEADQAPVELETQKKLTLEDLREQITQNVDEVNAEFDKFEKGERADFEKIKKLQEKLIELFEEKIGGLEYSIEKNRDEEGKRAKDNIKIWNTELKYAKNKLNEYKAGLKKTIATIERNAKKSKTKPTKPEESKELEGLQVLHTEAGDMTVRKYNPEKEVLNARLGALLDIIDLLIDKKFEILEANDYSKLDKMKTIIENNADTLSEDQIKEFEDTVEGIKQNPYSLKSVLDPAKPEATENKTSEKERVLPVLERAKKSLELVLQDPRLKEDMPITIDKIIGLRDRLQDDIENENNLITNFPKEKMIALSEILDKAERAVHYFIQSYVTTEAVNVEQSTVKPVEPEITPNGESVEPEPVSKKESAKIDNIDQTEAEKREEERRKEDEANKPKIARGKREYQEGAVILKNEVERVDEEEKKNQDRVEEEKRVEQIREKIDELRKQAIEAAEQHNLEKRDGLFAQIETEYKNLEERELAEDAREKAKEDAKKKNIKVVSSKEEVEKIAKNKFLLKEKQRLIEEKWGEIPEGERKNKQEIEDNLGRKRKEIERKLKEQNKDFSLPEGVFYDILNRGYDLENIKFEDDFVEISFITSVLDEDSKNIVRNIENRKYNVEGFCELVDSIKKSFAETVEQKVKEKVDEARKKWIDMKRKAAAELICKEANFVIAIEDGEEPNYNYEKLVPENFDANGDENVAHNEQEIEQLEDVDVPGLQYEKDKPVPPISPTVKPKKMSWFKKATMALTLLGAGLFAREKLKNNEIEKPDSKPVAKAEMDIAPKKEVKIAVPIKEVKSEKPAEQPEIETESVGENFPEFKVGPGLVQEDKDLSQLKAEQESVVSESSVGRKENLENPQNEELAEQKIGKKIFSPNLNEKKVEKLKTLDAGELVFQSEMANEVKSWFKNKPDIAYNADGSISVKLGFFGGEPIGNGIERKNHNYFKIRPEAFRLIKDLHNENKPDAVRGSKGKAEITTATNIFRYAELDKALSPKLEAKTKNTPEELENKRERAAKLAKLKGEEYKTAIETGKIGYADKHWSGRDISPFGDQKSSGGMSLSPRLQAKRETQELADRIDKETKKILSNFSGAKEVNYKETKPVERGLPQIVEDFRKALKSGNETKKAQLIREYNKIAEERVKVGEAFKIVKGKIVNSKPTVKNYTGPREF